MIQAIVLADGDVGSRAELDAAWPGWLAPSAFVVAADGGARHAASLGIAIDRWVGDGDSLGPEGVAALRASGIPVELAATDKDESDTELAMRAALERDPDAVTILGALGGARLDHALANLALLAFPGLRGRDVRIVSVAARVRLLEAPGPDGGPAMLALPGRIGDLVSLLPVGDDAVGVTTRGLAFPLDDEPLEAGRTRGLSNVRVAEGASVELRGGRLLVVESPATLR
jgi:thiamine pyrophosphokinase